MISRSLDCTGCGACVQKCPKKCIYLKENQYGFTYPEIDNEKCIECDLCSDVCHLENYKQSKKCEPSVYAISHKDKKVVQKSTSGGAFFAIAEKILANGGIVYGCAYDDNLKPCHVRIDDLKQINLLQGSKYIQSDIGNSYKDALNDLENGMLVLFTGTPCQIAGLKSFLGKEYDKLITADLICHGVPSYAYFRKFIEWFEKKNKFKVLDFNFRSKDNKGWSLSGMCIAEKNNKKVKKKVFYFDNYYYHYFLNSEIYRDSCYECLYTSVYRPGDFTLGDFWGAESIKLDFSSENGCSLLLVNSSKGESMLEDMNINLQKIPLQLAVKYNMQLKKPSIYTKDRERILEEYSLFSAEQIQKNYVKKYWKKRFIARIKYFIPNGIRHIMLVLKYKVQRG